MRGTNESYEECFGVQITPKDFTGFLISNQDLALKIVTRDEELFQNL